MTWIRRVIPNVVAAMNEPGSPHAVVGDQPDGTVISVYSHIG